MSFTTTRINQLVLDQLSTAEMRLLTLTVAVRKGLSTEEGIKGDLPQAVRSTLRKLVATNVVVDSDGVYALVRPAVKAKPADLAHATGKRAR